MVATFHLHCLGHRVKYGNPEAGSTTQQFLLTTRLCCVVEFTESFLFRAILFTYNIGLYICIYIFIKLVLFILFLLSSTVMFILHCILRYGKIFCEIDESIASWHNPSSDMIFLGVHSESIFPFMQHFFCSRKLCFRWSPCLLLIAELISLDTSGKPTVGFFLKITSPS